MSVAFLLFKRTFNWLLGKHLGPIFLKQVKDGRTEFESKNINCTPKLPVNASRDKLTARSINLKKSRVKRAWFNFLILYLVSLSSQ